MAIGWENRERLAARSAEHPEVALVEGENLSYPMAVGQHDDRGVGESDLVIGVAGDDAPCDSEVLGVEGSELEAASGDLVQQCELPLDAPSREREVVGLGQHERGEEERWPARRQHRGNVVMGRITSVGGCDQTARIDEDQSSPKPSDSS